MGGRVLKDKPRARWRVRNLDLDLGRGRIWILLEKEKVVMVLENDIMNKLPVDKNKNGRSLKQKREEEEEGECQFIGDPVSQEEASRRWPHRYLPKAKTKQTGESISLKSTEDSEEFTQARCHFMQAEVDGQIFNLEDDAYVKAEDGQDNFICKIVEMFEAVDGSTNFTAQWYYRAKDTVIGCCHNLVDDKRVFFSEIRDDNPLDCLVKKLGIVLLPLKVKLDIKERD
ncbi:DNA (cytosine-5)-methyltransferase CMT3 [Forsythia ovata]|uniref:DNA (Cytosine-5)-methyltransferase CMT3 n=1 Tax=Forsythia ovata TaxID=205694 RepID=A0ABD1X429_9LAMI